MRYTPKLADWFLFALPLPCKSSVCPQSFSTRSSVLKFRTHGERLLRGRIKIIKTTFLW
jgi:hypothetical protein